MYICKHYIYAYIHYYYYIIDAKGPQFWFRPGPPKSQDRPCRRRRSPGHRSRLGSPHAANMAVTTDEHAPSPANQIRAAASAPAPITSSASRSWPAAPPLHDASPDTDLAPQDSSPPVSSSSPSPQSSTSKARTSEAVRRRLAAREAPRIHSIPHLHRPQPPSFNPPLHGPRKIPRLHHPPLPDPLLLPAMHIAT